MRTALGARHAQLVQLLLCESLLLSAAGGFVGIAIAYWGIKAAPAVLTRTIPGLQDLAIDYRVLVFTGAICLTTAIIFAPYPAPTLDRRNPVDSLREGSSRTSTGLGKPRLQRGLVVLTVSLSCVLLVGRDSSSAVSPRSWRPTLDSSQPAVLTASMTLPRTFYTTAASVRTFHESLRRGLTLFLVCDGLPLPRTCR